MSTSTHQVNPQHGVQWKRRAASFEAFLGVERLNQINQRLSRHHLLHRGQLGQLGQKLLLFGLLFGGALLESPKPSCLPPINLVLAKDQMTILARFVLVFQSLPSKSARNRHSASRANILCLWQRRHPRSPTGSSSRLRDPIQTIVRVKSSSNVDLGAEMSSSIAGDGFTSYVVPRLFHGPTLLA